MSLKLDEDHITPDDICAHCGHAFNRAAGPRKKPREGDISVRIACAGVMAYKADGKLRKATEEEENLPDTRAAVYLIRKLFLQTPPEGRA